MIADSYFQVMIGDVVTDVHIIAIHYGKVFYALKPLGFEEKITSGLMTREKFKIHYWGKGFNFVNKNGAFSLKKKSLPRYDVELLPPSYVEIKFQLDFNKLTYETWQNFISQVNRIRVGSTPISDTKLNYNDTNLVSLMFKNSEEADKLINEVLPFFINNGITIDSPRSLKNKIREVTLRFRGYDNFYVNYSTKNKRKTFLENFFEIFTANFACSISGHAGIRNIFLGEVESQDYIEVKVLITNTDQIRNFNINLEHIGLKDYIDFVYFVKQIE